MWIFAKWKWCFFFWTSRSRWERLFLSPITVYTDFYAFCGASDINNFFEHACIIFILNVFFKSLQERILARALLFFLFNSLLLYFYPHLFLLIVYLKQKKRKILFSLKLFSLFLISSFVFVKCFLLSKNIFSVFTHFFFFSL